MINIILLGMVPYKTQSVQIEGRKMPKLIVYSYI